MYEGVLTDTALSNLFTMGTSSEKDPRQAIPAGYQIPNQTVRRLRAQLILEEALETINALGFNVMPSGDRPISMSTSYLATSLKEPDLEQIIDGCCDEIYVATGTLCACGAPDLLHLNEVNRANNAKFPKGQVLTNENGKFLKPEGWTPPNHTQHFQNCYHNLRVISERIVQGVKEVQG